MRQERCTGEGNDKGWMKRLAGGLIREKEEAMPGNALTLCFFLFTAAVIGASVWGPEALAGYKDRGILNITHAEEIEAAGEGFRYTLNGNEKLYILSQCLSSQSLPESDQSAWTRNADPGMDYQEITGTYAFVVNHKGPSGEEITDEEIYETCNSQLETLKSLGILPESVKTVEKASYDAVLYSAIDVLEPRNNVAVWKLSLSNSQKNANKENRLIDAYIDAESGKIYEFYVRTPMQWEKIVPDEMMEKWSGYMGIDAPEALESENPLLETTPYYKKYVFPGSGSGSTVATIGFYEGINELFLKISK